MVQSGHYMHLAHTCNAPALAFYHLALYLYSTIRIKNCLGVQGVECLVVCAFSICDPGCAVVQLHPLSRLVMESPAMGWPLSVSVCSKPGMVFFIISGSLEFYSLVSSCMVLPGCGMCCVLLCSKDSMLASLVQTMSMLWEAFAPMGVKKFSQGTVLLQRLLDSWHVCVNTPYPPMAL